tara:strand:- start:9790 stop:12201 length:2412 start_codon:yes stop_codon:yes gene_type:complete
MAAGLLAVALLPGAVLAADGASSVLAVTPPRATEMAAGETASFDIPAQPLAAALTAFGRQAGLQVSGDHADLSGITSRAVTGDLTPEAALIRMLQGTGVTFRFADAKTVVLSKPAAGGERVTLGTIAVEGQSESAWGPVSGYVARRSASGTKTDTPIIEVPRSVSVVTADQVEDQKVSNIREALRYTPGLVPETLGVDNRSTEIIYRGFGSDKALYRDGLNIQSQGFTALEPDTYGLERIEVLRGPASTLFGQNAPGGLVNVVTKRPPETFYSEAQLLGGSFDQVEGRFDVGGPVLDGGKVSFRLTGLHREGDTQIDYVDDSRTYIAPAVSVRLTDQTSLTVLGHFQNDDSGSLLQFLPASGTVLGNDNGELPASRFLGEPDFDSYENVAGTAGVLFEHRFDETATFRGNMRYGYADTRFDTVYTSGMATATTVNRRIRKDRAYLQSLVLDTQVEKSFDLAGSRNTVIAGFDHKNLNYDSVILINVAPTIDIFNPVYGQALNIPTEASNAFINSSDQHLTQSGFYFQDQTKLFDRVVVTLGGRYDIARSETIDRDANSTEIQKDTAFTGQAGLTYLFDNGLAPYASYAESFEPQIGTDFSGNTFVPTTGTQYEVGLKYQPPNRNMLFSLAAFELTRQNVTTTDPANTNFSIQTGEVRSRGLEFEARAGITDELSLIGAYTYQRVEITESNGTDVGSTPRQTPKHLASLWGDYTFRDGPLDGLGLSLGVRYTGATFGDSNSSFRVPEFAVLDAAMRYRLKDTAFTFEVNAKNLLDKEYISSCASTSQCFYGFRRTVLASLKAQW